MPTLKKKKKKRTWTNNRFFDVFKVPPASAGGPFLNPPVRPRSSATTVPLDQVQDYQIAVRSAIPVNKQPFRFSGGGEAKPFRFSGSGEAKPFRFSGSGEVDQHVMDEHQRLDLDAEVAAEAERAWSLATSQITAMNSQFSGGGEVTANQKAAWIQANKRTPIGYYDEYINRETLNIQSENFRSLLGDAYRNPLSYAIRANPDTGATEMTIGENPFLFSFGDRANMWSNATKGQPLINVLTLGGYEALDDQIEEATDLQIDIEGEHFDSGGGFRIEDAAGYLGMGRAGNPQPQLYAAYIARLEQLAKDNGVDVIYAHKGAVKVLQDMNTDAEKVGVDGVYTFSQDQSSPEGTFLNLGTEGNRRNFARRYVDYLFELNQKGPYFEQTGVDFARPLSQGGPNGRVRPGVTNPENISSLRQEAFYDSLGFEIPWDRDYDWTDRDYSSIPTQRRRDTTIDAPWASSTWYTDY